MKCRWCPKTFLRGGPSKAFERLKGHVVREHEAEATAAGLLDAVGELHADFGRGWMDPGEYNIQAAAQGLPSAPTSRARLARGLR